MSGWGSFARGLIGDSGDRPEMDGGSGTAPHRGCFIGSHKSQVKSGRVNTRSPGYCIVRLTQNHWQANSAGVIHFSAEWGRASL